MTIAAYITLAYAIFILGGGIAGYKFAQSKASLISGIIFGGMSGVAAVLLIEHHPLGPGLAGLSAVLVLVFFGLKCTRALRERKPFGRAGTIFLVSLAELFVLYTFI